MDYKAAIIHLSKVDPVLKRIIRKSGPCLLVPKSRRSPFESLSRAIANQQLNGRAAETILNRFIKLFPGRRFPKPLDLARVSDDQIRSAGFSRAKVAALRDLAQKTLEGVVPPSVEIKKLTDEEIVTRLIAVRGIGQWTAEMLLIFQLGRPDVLAANDFGIKKGFARAFGLAELPKPREVLAHAERWRPYRTVASWYLWRAAELP